ncbi:CHAP domain-containing protein [Staphylococcus americanisciuri]|uniref:CHAP domain-containing protein n=1 Tax=Staphylococcus americanisciuri TaxID=2973940 RepID=A0ABT2F4E3_9STAP|nr:CHAP domain-containing protein [Staphylococcus americanisciuri]MCS4487323.1 CHAP domain-containing protein [Staphylococcus americanisciuri]
MLLDFPLIANVFVSTTLMSSSTSTQNVQLTEDTTIYQLAQQFATTTQHIQELNHIKSIPLTFKMHQILKLPADHILVKPAHQTLPDFLAHHKLSIAQIQKFNPHLIPNESQQYIAISNKGMAHLSLPLLAQLLPSPPTHKISSQHAQQEQSTYKQVLPIHQYNNAYTPGQCTAYAYEQRAKRHLPIPTYWGDAKYWAMHAQQSGYTVSNQPRVNAILVSQEGVHGHVAIVEACDHNSIRVSEMNWQGEGIVSTRLINNPSAYQYIY